VIPPAAAWHDVECGAYRADLPVWEALADEHPGPILDVGAGTGRVALHLAALGREVTALDADPDLLAVLRRRDREDRVATVAADARELELEQAFALILVPMQTVQLLGGPEGRGRFLAGAARHLAPEGALAVALADALEPFDAARLPLPDVGEHEGLALTSQPVAVYEEDGGWVIERVRRAVAPSGRVEEADDRIRLDTVSPEALEAEAAAHGLRPLARREVGETAEHVGSTVVVLAR
jgi:SAM-dependent methyltransferase